MKVAIVGTGYVGLSLATLISQKYSVVAVELDNHGSYSNTSIDSSSDIIIPGFSRHICKMRIAKPTHS